MDVLELSCLRLLDCEVPLQRRSCYKGPQAKSDAPNSLQTVICSRNRNMMESVECPQQASDLLKKPDAALVLEHDEVVTLEAKSTCHDR